MARYPGPGIEYEIACETLTELVADARQLASREKAGIVGEMIEMLQGFASSAHSAEEDWGDNDYRFMVAERCEKFLARMKVGA